MIIQRLKNLLNKIQIHPFTYLYIFMLVYYNDLNSYIIVMILVILHEMCHLAMAFYFKFEISKIIVYPIGTCGIIDDLLYKSIKKDLIIILAGPLFHIFLDIILFILNLNNIRMYNKIILLFNLLPIYPLDGAKLIMLMLQAIGDLKKAMYFTLKISLLSLSVLSIYYLQINTFFIIIFLIYNQFIFYRFIRLYIYRYIISSDDHTKKQQFIHTSLNYRRGYKNIYCLDKGVYTENELLKVLLAQYPKL